MRWLRACRYPASLENASIGVIDAFPAISTS
jgi:hypothetical protein